MSFNLSTTLEHCWMRARLQKTQDIKRYPCSIYTAKHIGILYKANRRIHLFFSRYFIKFNA